MRVARRVAVVLGAMSLALPVWAQFGGPRMPGMNGVFHPVVGQGAVYDLQGGGDHGLKSMELSVVGKEDFQGQTGYWVETSFEAQRGPMVMKTLMVTEPPNPGPKRAIMLMNGQAYEFPMNNPMMGGRMAQSAPHDITNDKSFADLGTETITVPAGTYSCHHYRASDGSSEVWVSEKISPWGLVKSVSKDMTMVLSRQITDAKSKITGPVKPFDPMSFAQQQRPN